MNEEKVIKWKIFITFSLFILPTLFLVWVEKCRGYGLEFKMDLRH